MADDLHQCPFPFNGWPECKTTAAEDLGASYTVLIFLHGLGTVLGMAPILVTLARAHMARRHVKTQKGGLPAARARAHGDSMPALDRKGSLRARVAIALFGYAFLSCDPLGLANKINSDLVEFVHAIIVFAMLSVALSLVFRWVRGLLVLTDGLGQLNRVTRLYMALQALSVIVWVLVTLVHIFSPENMARLYKAIPLVFTGILLLFVYASASVYSMVALHRVSTSTQTSSTVSSQTLSRVQAIVHTLLLGSATVLFVVVPLTVERLLAILYAPMYPYLDNVDTLIDLLRMASLRLLCLVFSVGVAWMCMSTHARELERGTKMNRAAPVAASTTTELQMAVLKSDLEAGGEKRGFSDHDFRCIIGNYHNRPRQVADRDPSTCSQSSDQPSMGEMFPIRQLAA